MIRRTALASSIEQTKDRQTLALQETQRRTAVAANGFGPVPVTLAPYTFIAGESHRFVHGLGRTPVAWWPVDVTGDYGSFYRAAWDTNAITIVSQNASTATFRVQ